MILLQRARHAHSAANRSRRHQGRRKPTVQRVHGRRGRCVRVRLVRARRGGEGRDARRRQPVLVVVRARVRRVRGHLLGHVHVVDPEHDDRHDGEEDGVEPTVKELVVDIARRPHRVEREDEEGAPHALSTHYNDGKSNKVGNLGDGFGQPKVQALNKVHHKPTAGASDKDIAPKPLNHTVNDGKNNKVGNQGDGFGQPKVEPMNKSVKA